MLEVNKNVCARKEVTGGIVDIDFYKQRTRCHVNGVGIANEGAMKGLAWEFIEGQRGWRTRTRGAGVHLGNRDVQAQLTNGGDVKEFPRLCAGPCIDECSDIRTAGGDDAVEGGVDLFERLQLFKTPDVGGAGFGRGFDRAEIADRLVGFLLGHGTSAYQVLPAAGGDLGNVQVGLRGVQVRSSLQQLLVNFGSFDLRQQLAFLDMSANVEIPAVEIATGSRIDRRVTECLGVSGQNYFLCGGTFPRKNHGQGR